MTSLFWLRVTIRESEWPGHSARQPPPFSVAVRRGMADKDLLVGAVARYHSADRGNIIAVV
jgi:hypothetical protein